VSDSVAGMVLANRPWQLVRDLPKVLVTSLATATFLVVSSSSWPLADQLGAFRLGVLCVIAVGALATWLVVAHGLWNQPTDEATRGQVARANAATILTLFFGLLFAYLVLFVVLLAATKLVIPSGYYESTLGHATTFGDFAALSWFICSVATVGGAIGSGLETDDDVHETVTRYRVEPARR